MDEIELLQEIKTEIENEEETEGVRQDLTSEIKTEKFDIQVVCVTCLQVFSEEFDLKAHEISCSRSKPKKPPNQKIGKTTLDHKTKEELFRKIEGGGKSVVELANEFSVSPTTIYRFRKYREKFNEKFEKFKIYEGAENRFRFREANNAPLDKAVYAWLMQERALGSPVTTAKIQEKALYFNEKITQKLHKNGAPSNSNFKASCGWLRNFKARFGLKNFDNNGVVQKNDEKHAADVYIKQFRKTSKGFVDIFSVDEFGLHWKALPDVAQSKNSGVNPNSVDRITCAMCINQTGTIKIPITIIAKSSPFPLESNSADFKTKYLHQTNGYMDRLTFKKWLETIFEPAVNEIYKGARILLVVDQAPGHKIDKYKNITIEYLPTSITHLIQPTEQYLITALKAYYRLQILKRFRSRNCKSAEEFLGNFNLYQAQEEIGEAWDSVDENMIVTAWSKLLDDKDESDYEYAIETEVLLAEASKIPIYAKLTDIEITNWVVVDYKDKGFQTFTSNEIVNLVTNGIDPLYLPVEASGEENSNEIEMIEEEEDPLNENSDEAQSGGSEEESCPTKRRKIDSNSAETKKAIESADFLLDYIQEHCPDSCQNLMVELEKFRDKITENS